MREIRQSGSEGGGNEQTVSPYPYLALCLFLFFCFYFPPTPNPLPSGKRALRFASPGFYPPPLFLLYPSPPTALGGSLSFYLVLIDMGFV